MYDCANKGYLSKHFKNNINMCTCRQVYCIHTSSIVSTLGLYLELLESKQELCFCNVILHLFILCKEVLNVNSVHLPDEL